MIFFEYVVQLQPVTHKGVGRKISRGGGNVKNKTEK